MDYSHLHLVLLWFAKTIFENNGYTCIVSGNILVEHVKQAKLCLCDSVMVFLRNLLFFARTAHLDLQQNPIKETKVCVLYTYISFVTCMFMKFSL